MVARNGSDPSFSIYFIWLFNMQNKYSKTDHLENK